MSGVKEIRDRMRSIGDTKKITGAMYMIASNKLQKARKAHEQTEPYFYALQSMIDRLQKRYVNLKLLHYDIRWAQ